MNFYQAYFGDGRSRLETSAFSGQSLNKLTKVAAFATILVTQPQPVSDESLGYCNIVPNTIFWLVEVCA